MRKPKVENKYKLDIKKARSLKILDRSRIEEPLFWRNDVVNAWCISGNTIKNQKDREYCAYSEFWVGIYDKNDKIRISCDAHGGMCTYKFNKFFDLNEIENDMDLEVQEKLLDALNKLIDEGILGL